MVLALEAALELNAFPTSMTGLINRIYNRTMQQSLQDYQEEKELLEALKLDFDLSDASRQEVYKSEPAPIVFKARGTLLK